MIYDDEQIINNVSTINEMAKEYAKAIEQKRKEKLSKPLSNLKMEQLRARDYYNHLLKFAKQNALPFIKELLTEATENIDKIEKIEGEKEKKYEEKDLTNNYVKIFKDALQCEINSIQHCLHCFYNCKEDTIISAIQEIEDCCKEHIKKLIDCF